MSSPDTRGYRDEGDLVLEFVIPPPDGLRWRVDVEDQGLEIKIDRSPMNLWTVRVNPPGGADLSFENLVHPPPPGRLHVRLTWKRGDMMRLYLNHQAVGSKPFVPPALN